MRKRVVVGIFGVALAGGGLYRLRRQLIAWWFRLPPARNDVTLERNIPVPLPDGVTLMADHYIPRAEGEFPTILIRTPYGRGKEAGLFGQRFMMLGQRLAERGYHVVIQGTRGRFDSGGDFEPFVHEATDGRATLNWIARQPWFNGVLGMWGPSYLGFAQWAVAADAPPYLKALVPAITGSQFVSLIYPDGAFNLDTWLRWTFWVDAMEVYRKRSTFGALYRLMRRESFLAPALQHLPLIEADQIAVGEPAPFYREWLAHPRRDDPYWKGYDHSVGVRQVTAPTHLVSGWYDILLRELLDDYAALKAAGRSPYLTVGPWFHLESEVQLEAVRQGIIWFDAHLKNDLQRLRGRPVRIFVMGANEWREEESWPPPAQEVRYFLHARGGLSAERPEGDSPTDHYRYNPAEPTPIVGGPLFNMQGGPQDNRSREARSDVLCYTTPPLTEDVEVIGSVQVELYARSSLEHTDFFVRLCDVHPDGCSINICDGLFRVDPGNGEQQPDGSWRLDISLWPTANRFLQGHRIRLQVSSGAHPHWNRNLGSGEPVAIGTRLIAADQTIYHDHVHPSALVLPVMM